MERLLTFIDADDKPARIPEADAEAWRQQEEAAGRKVRPAVSFVDTDGSPLAVEEADADAFEREMQAAGRKVERGFGVLAGEEPIIVPQSRRQAFLGEYRTKPEYEADREAARKAVGRGQGAVGSVGDARKQGFKQGAARGLRDAGVTISKGLAAVPQAVVGAADLGIDVQTLPGRAAQALAAATVASRQGGSFREAFMQAMRSMPGGRIGKAVEGVADLKGLQEGLDAQYSPEMQEANREMREATGAGMAAGMERVGVPGVVARPAAKAAATVGAMVRNPETIAHGVLESLPVMGVGGGAGRALGAAGMGRTLAGAVGEGLMAAGSQQEGVRSQTPGGRTSAAQTLAALGAGAGTAAFGALSGRVARKLGLEAADIDTLMAGGSSQGIRQNLALRLAGGMVQEGLLEEMGQSANEKIFENLALGRPWHEGVAAAGAQGATVGAAMGVGANLGRVPGAGTVGRGQSAAGRGQGAQLPPPLPGRGATLNAQRPTPNAQVGSAPAVPIGELEGRVPLMNLGPLPGVGATLNAQVGNAPAVPVGELEGRVPLIDTSPLPPSLFAPPPAPQLGPTRQAAETLRVNRDIEAGIRDGEARRQQVAAESEQQRLEERNQPGRESQNARKQRLSLDSFYEQQNSRINLPMIERIVNGQAFGAPTKKSGGEYDAWKALGERYPELRMLMTRQGGVPIDSVAMQYGMEPEAMVAQIAREWQEYDAWKKRDGQTLEQARDKEIAEEAQDNLTQPRKVTPDQLQPGDIVKTPDGQWRRVEREPDVVVLADGTDIALPADSDRQLELEAHVPADQPGHPEAQAAYSKQERQMWAEANAETIAAQQAAGTETPATQDAEKGVTLPEPAAALALESQTAEEIEAERARVEEQQREAAERGEIERRAAAPITGNAGDQTMLMPGMEGEVDVDLFDAADVAARRALGMEGETVGSGQSAVGSGAQIPPPLPGSGATLNAQRSTLNAQGEDIEAAAGERGREGAVRIPQSFSPRAQRAIRRVLALFSPNQGVGESAYEMVNRAKREIAAAGLEGREARNRLRAIVQELEQTHGRAAVLDAISQVQTGAIGPAAWSARFGLRPGNEMERLLRTMVYATDERSKRILKWVGNSKEMRRKADEAKLYQTRAYLLHALGEDYVPPESARRAAVLEVEAGLAKAVEHLARQATAVRGKRKGRRLDVLTWLETGDEAFLASASKTRAAAARQLRSNWLELRDLIEGLALNGDEVTARINAEAAGKAADGIVEYYLQRGAQRGGEGGPGVEIGHLRMRFMEGAFRQLYGEITDPTVRQQITTEVQGRMLAEMTLFERIFAECEGSVWARRPDPAKGIMERLGRADSPSDRQRYGDMAGRFVTREFRDLVDAERHKGAVFEVMQRMYFGPMAVQRMGKLLSPKTISRNYITAITGLALETGDVFLPGYWPAWAEGHKLAVDYARGKPAAVAQVAELVKMGVFSTSSSSYTADLQAALGPSGRKLKKLGRAVTEAYAFIDFPTKYAAYVARQRAGMSRDQAAQHVRDLYQNRERTPPVVGKFSRIGLADYLSYTYDSGRMAVNSLKFGVEQARQGRLLPMFGWVTARAGFALASVQATKMLSDAAGQFYAAVRQALRKDDDDEEKRRKGGLGVAPFEDAQLSRFRDLVAPYDKQTPMLAWREERGGKLTRIGYAIAGGQTAFPMEDIVLGALQSRQHGVGFLEAVGNSALQLLDEGMYVDAAAKAIGGQSFAGQRTPTGKGLWQARPGQEDPERAAIVSDAIKGWIADLAPAYPAQMFVQLMRRADKERAGIEEQGIFARTPLNNAEIVSRGHRLVRGYTLGRGDLNAQVRGKIMPQMQALRRTREIINNAAGMRIEKGGALPRMERAAENAQQARDGYIRKVAETLNSARSIAPEWYDNGSILLVLKEAGMPTDDAFRVLTIANGGQVDTRYIPAPTISPFQTGLYQQLTGER